MQISSVLVFLISSLILLSHAFPLITQEPPSELALIRRVAYSVVAVDGGSISTSPSANTAPIQTIIRTSDQTETVTALASTPPPSTKTVVSTVLVNQSELAKTVQVSLTKITSKALSSTSRLLYTVVNAGDTTSSPMVGSVTRTSTASITVSCTLQSSPNSSNPSPFPSAISSTASMSSVTATVRSNLPQYVQPAIGTAPPAEAGWVAPAGLLPPPSSAITTQSTSTIATSKTYDDGMWHTTWRTWNTTSTTSSRLPTTATPTGGSEYWEKMNE
ncbi:hypothetical protein N7G274_001707 [Stereocaulon virgatum]|uniref:Uncharacterized protein n=1 Tax=Stereocaulon virgatum TaxID=373712 RepID=A0ABR4AM19_9LECA